ncbi:MAG: DNA photolyase family protein [Flavobacteriales bacterium]|nr:DNA photolyase family protein [Flavobacteriales bacterium]
MADVVNIFWHRRDLRIEDNAGLYKALSNGSPVQPVFIFDKGILNKLSTTDARVVFIHQELARLTNEYEKAGSSLHVYYGTLHDVWPQILKDYPVAKVFCNRDYEPYALERDKSIFSFLQNQDIPLIGSKDHVIFEKSEVVKDDGLPYTVFTPYMKKWKKTLVSGQYDAFDSKGALANLHTGATSQLPSLTSMGFEETSTEFPGRTVDSELLEVYGDKRDMPSIKGTSRLSLHLRFGTVSIRSLARKGTMYSEKWLNELIWRDFYQMLIFHFPHSVDQAFKAKYDLIPWDNNEDHFNAWCAGKTGYPIVDAGMRELNATGFMHNRVRMIVASFLTKHLLIDWRWGERYFAEKLLDFELASNIGGWQWAASSGADAAPYFRVFNPESQQKKFDPEFKYIRRWVPEYGTPSYPQPIVEHKSARQRAIDTFKEALS